MDETLADLGEKEILNRLKQYVKPGQIDDDTAQIGACGNELLINTDLLVDKIHFSTNTTTPSDVGWRAISTNFSDLAASGLDQIVGITVGLVAPPNTSWEWVDGVYQGIKEALDNFGGNLLGGDCSKGSEKVLAITAIGTLSKLRIHRAHAKPGDWIITSGQHGLSRLGLELLIGKELDKLPYLSPELKAKAIQSHKRPEPPLDALKKLLLCKPSQTPWRAGGTDSSDGLIEAINNLCWNSNCQALLSSKNLPRHSDWPKGSKWDQWCINGGEDFELVISLPPEWGQQFLDAMPSSYFLGTMKEGIPKISWKEKNDFENFSPEFNHF